MRVRHYVLHNPSNVRFVVRLAFYEAMAQVDQLDVDTPQSDSNGNRPRQRHKVRPEEHEVTVGYQSYHHGAQVAQHAAEERICNKLSSAAMDARGKIA